MSTTRAVPTSNHVLAVMTNQWQTRDSIGKQINGRAGFAIPESNTRRALSKLWAEGYIERKGDKNGKPGPSYMYRFTQEVGS